ncbi:MAG: integrase arm-type DNA-binding domain-containing protein [Marinobacterium sp.]|nr:integrase arm-type DNA-binding domain-containing protein [Marinobacterium sp.]
MPLTDRQVQTARPAEKEYKLSDEKGMYLLVTKAGTKSFRLKYRFGGKEKKLILGTYPDITLRQARDMRDSARQQLATGIDPSAARKAEKAASQALNENSFEAIAREWFLTRLSTKTENYQRKVISAMERDLFPKLGARPIQEIQARELLQALRAIEQRGAIETAHRTKQLAGQVFRYAIATGRAERDPTPDLRGALTSHKPEHFAAITDPKAVGHLMAAIEQYNGTLIVRAALKCSALWFCRPGELRHLEWSQVNWEEKRIELIAEKTHQQHIIPLSRQSLEILESLQPLTGRSRYVFPSAKGRARAMSENAVRAALRTLGYDNNTMTGHGFRAMARTLLDEVLGYRVEWIEQQLAHAVKDANGRAYNRTKHLSQRTEMMQRWADYLDQLRDQAMAPNVIAVNFNG